jgi:hypothetical protein
VRSSVSAHGGRLTIRETLRLLKEHTHDRRTQKQTVTMDEETPPSARALLHCLLPLDTLKKIRDQNLLVLEPVDTLKEL